MTSDVTQKKPSILYIDDNFENRLLVRRVLQAEYTVLEAEDGLTGLKRVRELVPDLILLDINLPDIDGYEIARRLKTMDEITTSIPVIAMTANVMHGDRERALAAGFDGYIQKPIDVDLLPDQISHFLSGQEWK